MSANLTKDSYTTIKYQIVFGTHDINASLINTTGLPDGVQASYSKTFFTDSDTLSVTLASEEDVEFGNYSVVLYFNVFSDGNSTQQNVSVSDSVLVEIKRSRKECFNKALEEGARLTVGDTNFTISDVGIDKVTFNINGDLASYGEGEYFSISNCDVYVIEMFPSLKAVKLGIYTEETCPTVSYILDSDGDGVPDKNDKCPDEYGEQENGCPKPKIKKLLIVRMEGETMRRGERFYFRVLENGTNEPVGGASVIFTNMDTGEVIGTCITDSYGIGSVMVEDDIESDRVLATVEKPGYVGSSEVYNFPEPYEEYIKKKTLVINLNDDVNETIVGSTISGVVTNKKDEFVGKVDVEILRDGEKLKTIETNDKGEFSYKCTENGTILLRPIKEHYKYEEMTIEVLGDSDRDSVPDKYDKCPDRRGTENNSGCPEIRPEITIFDEKNNKIGFAGLEAGKTYTISLVDEKNGSIIPYSGEVLINDESYTMHDGSLEFDVEKEGYYTITIQSDELNVTETYKAKEAPGFDWSVIGMLMVISIIGVIIYFVVVNRGSLSFKSDTPKFVIGKTPSSELPPPPGSKGVE